MTQQFTVVGLSRATVLITRMQTNRAYEFMGANPPSFQSFPPHANQWRECTINRENAITIESEAR